MKKRPPNVLDRQSVGAKHSRPAMRARIWPVKNLYTLTARRPSRGRSRPEENERPRGENRGQMAHARVVPDIKRCPIEPGGNFANVSIFEPQGRILDVLEAASFRRAANLDHRTVGLLHPAPSQLAKSGPVLGAASAASVDEERGGWQIAQRGTRVFGARRVQSKQRALQFRRLDAQAPRVVDGSVLPWLHTAEREHLHLLCAGRLGESLGKAGNRCPAPGVSPFDAPKVGRFCALVRRARGVKPNHLWVVQRQWVQVWVVDQGKPGRASDKHNLGARLHDGDGGRKEAEKIAECAREQQEDAPLTPVFQLTHLGGAGILPCVRYAALPLRNHGNLTCPFGFGAHR